MEIQVAKLTGFARRKTYWDRKATLYCSCCSQQISVKDFLTFPSPTKLAQLGHSGAESLLKELGTNASDPEKVVEMITKVSLVVSKDDEAKVTACECADKLLQNLFKQDSNTSSKVANAILVNIGLLKGEDKKYKPPANIAGALIVLDHVVRQPYFPKLARDIIQLFVSKPNPILEKIPEVRHKLLQTLYAF